MKKVRKTTRPFRHYLNQIPYDYTVEVTNRFKGLALKDKVPEDIWMEVHDSVEEAGIKTIPKKRNAKRQNSFLRRPCKYLRKEEKLEEKEKRKHTHLNAEIQRIARR